MNHLCILIKIECHDIYPKLVLEESISIQEQTGLGIESIALNMDTLFFGVFVQS